MSIAHQLHSPCFRGEAMGGGRQQGLSLVEVLIALVIVTVGLLGMAGLQAFSLKNNTSAYHRSQANAMAYDILDSMRANRAPAAAGAYNVDFDDSLGTGTRAASDVSDWKRLLAQLLPSGQGSVGCDTNTLICTITVRWDDTRSGQAGQELLVSTRL